MSTSRHINKICIAVVAVMLILTLLFINGEALGVTTVSKTVKYASTLFDTSYVHKIDIVMDDWDSFIENCENEEYATCTVVVDGKKHSNIAIRAKGNTSLSTVRSMGSQRYSFKLEFDHYESGKSLDGLDKLCLNNLIQDNTMMKDYLVYQMMNDFGVDSPLCSYAYLTVNGQDWGLYLAVEGIEESFQSRTYGSEAGELYKPDSMSFGGGRGNGRGFNIDDFDFDFDGSGSGNSSQPSGQGNFDPGGQFPSQPGGGMQPGGGGFGFGSDDVKLKYIDDDPDSYPNIFDNAKTEVSKADKKRLIDSLEKLSAYSDLESVLDMDEVLRYFVVHNFVCNGDSYTGSMIHNYYLHEEDGQLSMIPWDYNLAFGTFQGGNASGTVNTSIDKPVSNGNVDDRPMVGWIFSNESYTEEYHKLFAEFIEKWFTNGELEKLISDTAEMIRSYVEKDPTKFCTAEEFDKGVETLTQFVALRGEAVSRQLAGDSTAVDTGTLNLSDMGSMGGGMSRPDSQSSEEWKWTRPDQSSEQESQTAQEPSTEQQTEPESEQSGEQWTMPDPNGGQGSFPFPGQNGESGGFPFTDENGSFNFDPSQDWSQFKPGGETQGNSDEQNQSEAESQEESSSSRSGKGSGKRPSGGSSDNGGNGSMPDFSGGGNSQVTFWILTGISALVLAGGILVAKKAFK